MLVGEGESQIRQKIMKCVHIPSSLSFTLFSLSSPIPISPSFLLPLHCVCVCVCVCACAHALFLTHIYTQIQMCHGHICRGQDIQKCCIQPSSLLSLTGLPSLDRLIRRLPKACTAELQLSSAYWAAV